MIMFCHMLTPSFSLTLLVTLYTLHPYEYKTILYLNISNKIIHKLIKTFIDSVTKFCRTLQNTHLLAMLQKFYLIFNLILFITWNDANELFYSNDVVNTSFHKRLILCKFPKACLMSVALAHTLTMYTCSVSEREPRMPCFWWIWAHLEQKLS